LKPPRKRSFYDLPSVKAVSFYATVLGFIFSLPSETAKKTAPAVPVAAIAEAPSASRLPQTTRRPIVQSSSGIQNVNLNDVRQDVKIQYNATARRAGGLADEKALPVVPASVEPGSIAQISHGTQNVNLSDVGGRVDIRFGSAPTARENTTPEEK